MSEITAEKVKALLANADPSSPYFPSIDRDGEFDCQYEKAFCEVAPEVFKAYLAKCEEVDLWKKRAFKQQDGNQGLQSIIEKQREVLEGILTRADYPANGNEYLALREIIATVKEALALTQQQTGGAV